MSVGNKLKYLVLLISFYSALNCIPVYAQNYCAYLLNTYDSEITKFDKDLGNANRMEENKKDYTKEKPRPGLKASDEAIRQKYLINALESLIRATQIIERMKECGCLEQSLPSDLYLIQD